MIISYLGKMEGMGRGRKRRNQLPNDRSRRYRKFKNPKRLCRTLWKNRFGRGYGPVAKTGNVIILMMIIYVQQKIRYDYVCICYQTIYACYTTDVGVDTYKNVVFTLIHGQQYFRNTDI